MSSILSNGIRKRRELVNLQYPWYGASKILFQRLLFLQSIPEFNKTQLNDDESPTNWKPQLFTQDVLNDLVRDLGLTKEKPELLCTTPKQKRCRTSIYHYHTVYQFFYAERGFGMNLALRRKNWNFL